MSLVERILQAPPRSESAAESDIRCRVNPMTGAVDSAATVRIVPREIVGVIRRRPAAADCTNARYEQVCHSMGTCG